MDKKVILRKVLIASMFIILPIAVSVPIYVIIKKKKPKKVNEK